MKSIHDRLRYRFTDCRTRTRSYIDMNSIAYLIINILTVISDRISYHVNSYGDLS